MQIRLNVRALYNKLEEAELKNEKCFYPKRKKNIIHEHVYPTDMF